MTQVALLYPGAMGRALAEALAPFDHTLISHLGERSARTRENARSVGVHFMRSFQELVDTAELVVSLVTPLAAAAVADDYAAALCKSRNWTLANRRPLFLDANSIAPPKVARIAKVIEAAGGRFVDGVFLGPSNPITRRTMLMLSGADAPIAAEIFEPALPVRVVGTSIGQASAVKMAIALMNKALIALFLEMTCAAAKAGCLESNLSAMRDLYPGIMEFIERNLPTYPTHAARRIEEMREALGWFAELGQSASMTQAAIVVLERISNGGLKPSERNFKHLLQNIVALDPLAKDAREVSNSQRDA